MKKIYLLLIAFLLGSCKTVEATSTNQAKVYNHYKTIKPNLCLTFDDGPNTSQTLKVLDILDKYKIKATFFMVGENIEYQKDVVKKLYNKGHEIGNHFYAHENINKISKEEIKESILKTNELIYGITGKNPTVLRPPYGFVNEDLKDICGELNMSIILWTADKDSRDWELTPASEMIENVTKKVTNGDIFLFHDGSKKFTNTLEAIDVIIPKLQDKGYRWVSVSTLINEKK